MGPNAAPWRSPGDGGGDGAETAGAPPPKEEEERLEWNAIYDAINVERDEAKEAADDKAGGRPRKATRQII